MASQINDSLQAALLEANYSSSTSTTIVQVKEHLESVLSNVIVASKAVQDLPPSGVTADQVQGVVPQEISLVVALKKATSALKNLSSPLSPGDGDVVITITRQIQERLVEAVEVYGAKAPACDAAVPGLRELSYKTRESHINALVEALHEAIPYDTQRNAINHIKSSIDKTSRSVGA